MRKKHLSLSELYFCENNRFALFHFGKEPGVYLKEVQWL